MQHPHRLSRKLRGQPVMAALRAVGWSGLAHPTYIPGRRAPSDLATKYAVDS